MLEQLLSADKHGSTNGHDQITALHGYCFVILTLGQHQLYTSRHEEELARWQPLDMRRSEETRPRQVSDY